jgi:hypothetical protein
MRQYLFLSGRNSWESLTENLESAGINLYYTLYVRCLKKNGGVFGIAKPTSHIFCSLLSGDHLMRLLKLLITESKQFGDWLTERNSFLLVLGPKGCGKYPLCATALQHVQQHRRGKLSKRLSVTLWRLFVASRKMAGSSG